MLGEGHFQSPPSFALDLNRRYFLTSESVMGVEERRIQVSPQGLALEIRDVKIVPGRFANLPCEGCFRIVASFDECSIVPLDHNPFWLKYGTLVLTRKVSNHPFFGCVYRHYYVLQIVALAFHKPDPARDGCGNLDCLHFLPAVETAVRFDCRLQQVIHKASDYFLCHCLLGVGSDRARSCGRWKGEAKHRPAAFRLGFRCLVLDYVPVFDEYPILEANNICDDPTSCQPVAGKASMQNDILAISRSKGIFVSKRCRDRLDEVKKSTATRRNMGAMLNVVGRPESLSRCVIALVEEQVKRFENNVFILGIAIYSHNSSLFVRRTEFKMWPVGAVSISENVLRYPTRRLSYAG